MLNRAIEGAADFQAMMEKIVSAEQAEKAQVSQLWTGENRAARRARERAERKKGASTQRRQKQITADTMALAIHGAAKPDRADVDQVVAHIATAHKALREGVATEQQWSVLAGALDTARMIEKQGVVRGIHEHIASAHHALQSVYTRAKQPNPQAWRPTVLHYHELDAISAFVDLHAFQIRQLSRKEFLSAITAAVGYVRGHGNVAVLTSEVTA